MKKLNCIFLLIFLITACNDAAEKNVKSTDKQNDSVERLSYSKNDLSKIKWIEGSWKGMFKNEPFYEIYRLTNDSTLEVISYDWNGKDSSNTSRTYVHWKDSAYYLGNEQNWKVVSISDSQITMKKNYKASNDIIWKFHDADSWDALLEHKNGTDHYQMERVGTIEQMSK